LNTDFLAKVATSNEIVLDDEDVRLPQAALFSLGELANQIEWTKKRIDKLERAIVFEAKRDEDMRRLAMIPGVVAIIAASIKALIPDPNRFKSGRHFAGSLGFTQDRIRVAARSASAGYQAQSTISSAEPNLCFPPDVANDFWQRLDPVDLVTTDARLHSVKELSGKLGDDGMR
jgi:hypothetical protein